MCFRSSRQLSVKMPTLTRHATIMLSNHATTLHWDFAAHVPALRGGSTKSGTADVAASCCKDWRFLANGDNNAGGADDATIRCKMQKIIATKPSTWSRSCSIWFRASLPKRPTRATTAKDPARIWQEVGRRLTYQRSFAPAPCTTEYPSESHVM